MARATALIAPSWETIRRWSSSSMRRSFSDSSSLSAVIGIPVQRETTSSMSALVTDCGPSRPSDHCSRTTCTCSRAPGAVLAEERPLARRRGLDHHPDAGREAPAPSPGTAASRSFTRLPASSMRSIALSGRKRSVM